MSREKYVFGSIKVIKCECGAWNSQYLDCWYENDRKQTIAEAFAEVHEAGVDLIHELAKALRLVK